MYSLLIKDRSYPIAVYMNYMTRVKGFTRTQAVDILTTAAVKMGIRDSAAAPANNTVAEWGKSIEAPLWSVVSAMTILEQFGKVPFTDQEWAFWSYAVVERGGDTVSYTGKWQEWIRKAQVYKAQYEKRGDIRRKLTFATSPQIAMKVILAFRGNQRRSLTIAEVFANIDNSAETVSRVTRKVNSSECFNDEDVMEVVTVNDNAKKLYAELLLTIQELADHKLIDYRSSGNITIT
ncbi:hypothetical protein D4X44_21315 [Salmonella enterica subsp. enterica serovar Enteritidis]|nr:hypothetical protein [Salmonella enterica subsp. enterica serovar Enteritidis]